MNEIEQALTRIFERHRIVFWYDDQRELRPEFEAVALPGVEKIVLENNPFGVKYRILREQPRQKFLLYHEGPQPEDDLDNWLLDVQLAHGEFRADRVALWLTELGLPLTAEKVIAPHTEFFQAARRREALRAMLNVGDSARQIHLKMLAVCARAEPRLDDILKRLLDELAEGRDDKLHLIRRCALDEVLWERLARAFDYTSESPGLRDFAITLFKACYKLSLGELAELNHDALVFLKQWQDSVSHQRAFAALSEECAAILDIKQDLMARDYHSLLNVGTFELVDLKILSELVRDVARRTVTGAEVADIIRQRRRSYWYENHQHEYAAIAAAATLMDTLNTLDLTIPKSADLAAVVERYTSLWAPIDHHYRKFITHVRQSGQSTLFAALGEAVENLYTNAYLLQVNDQWQAVIDDLPRWDAPPALSQATFFERRVRPFLARGHKVFVVISDGMRYEIGAELLHRIRQEDRYDAEIEPALTLLPSYTQLGMAALLPHEQLEITDDKSATVLVDGQSSAGAENRKKLLDWAYAGRATALQAEDLLAMNRDESRALFRDHDVVYVYHNRIDAIGDHRDSEERTFDAAEETLEELIRIIKKLANANVTNMLITADHGFIYQHQPLDESDFIGQDVVGAEITKRDRRFVLGRGLRETTSFKRFTSAEMGLSGDLEILLPKSINRLRVRGAGSRYVHGGAAVQEIIIPVLKINKKRESDVDKVEVDILRGASTVITSGQVSVTFYQTAPVTAKMQPRHLRAGIYTQAGDLISDQHTLHFDIASENPRERERPVRFILTQKAEEANEQDVILRLEEREGETSHYTTYKTVRYTLRRTFTSDFDF